MDIKSPFDVNVGDGVKYFDTAIGSYRSGKVVKGPSEISTQFDRIWCSFDDENVPEAIDISITKLYQVNSPTDSIVNKEVEPPPISEEITCNHPKEYVVSSYLGQGASAKFFWVCKKCGADWDA